MPYKVDDAAFWTRFPVDAEPWVRPQVSRKIAEIRELADPRSQGGEYRGKWAYTAGKLHILAMIDDGARCVRLLKLLRLP